VTLESDRAHQEVVSLRDYIESRLEAIERATEVAITASQRAVEKAEIANNARFASVNEFRQALQDQTREYLPRAEFTIHHRTLEEKVDKIGIEVSQTANIRQGKVQGVNTIAVTIYSALVAAGAAATVVLVIKSLGHI
jgi:hypothetical protein